MKRIYKRNNDNWAMGAVIIVIVLLVVGIVGTRVWAWNHVEVYQACIVEDKDRTAKSSGGSSDARVYTTCGVFRVGDDMLRGKFTSADTYASINVGDTYDFTTSGVRFGPLSVFPNVIEAKKV